MVGRDGALRAGAARPRLRGILVGLYVYLLRCFMDGVLCERWRSSVVKNELERMKRTLGRYDAKFNYRKIPEMSKLYSGHHVASRVRPSILARVGN